MALRRLVILAAVLALLLGIGAWLKGRERTVSSMQPTSTPLLPADWTLDSLTAVELSIGKAESPSVRITKDPRDGWRVNSAFNAPADLEKLTRFIGALKGLSGEERARGEIWFPDFGLGENVLTLSLRRGEQEVRSLAIGRGKKDWSTNFVRPLEGNTIYAVETDLLSEAGIWGALSSESVSPKNWVDLRLFPVDPATRVGVELAERVKEGWVVRAERHEPFDSDTQSWLDAVTALRGSAVLDPKGEEPAFKPQWRWIFLQRGGARTELEESIPDAKEKKEAPLKVRLLPEGPYLTVTAASIEGYRQQLLPGASPPKDSPSKSKKAL